MLYSAVLGQSTDIERFFALEFFVGELSFIVLSTIQAVSSSQDIVEFTGAYSPFRRLRLKPLCAQNTANTKEERASVFPEF